MDVIYTSTIPMCQPCQWKKRKVLATRRAPTLTGERWDMCDACCAELAADDGVQYLDMKLAPVRQLRKVAVEDARKWEYETRDGRVSIVPVEEGRFKTVQEAVTYAVASARWFGLPVLFEGEEIWTPKKV